MNLLGKLSGSKKWNSDNMTAKWYRGNTFYRALRDNLGVWRGNYCIFADPGQERYIRDYCRKDKNLKIVYPDV